jgi:undecaprenyl-phosphate 4-deoxy-4-formamido-L-arabinose transferase
MAAIQNITILVPLYNEEQSIVPLVKRLDAVIGQSAERISVLFIDDGSRDNTAAMIEENPGKSGR